MSVTEMRFNVNRKLLGNKVDYELTYHKKG